MSAPTIERTAVRSRAARKPPARSRIVGVLLSVTLIVATIAVLLPFYAAWKVVGDAGVDDRQPTDAIVVLGAAQFNGRPSPVLAARLAHAKVLYRQSVAPRIVTVGGKQRGDRYTEARAGLAYLVDHGVPAADVSAVGRGRDTQQSLEAVALMAEREGWRNITLVSDPAHMARAQAIADRLGFTTHLSPTRRGDGSTMTGGYMTREVAGWLAFTLVQRWSTPRLLG